MRSKNFTATAIFKPVAQFSQLLYAFLVIISRSLIIIFLLEQWI